jgi:hypothetical protein
MKGRMKRWTSRNSTHFLSYKHRHGRYEGMPNDPCFSCLQLHLSQPNFYSISYTAPQDPPWVPESRQCESQSLSSRWSPEWMGVSQAPMLLERGAKRERF